VPALQVMFCVPIGAASKTFEQPAQRLGSVALQAEVVLELPDDPFDELLFTRGPSTNYPGPGPFGTLLRGGGLARAQALLLGTIRNTGKHGANRSTSSSGASLSIGMCALALDARSR
jgi:hypothetical protein